MATYIDADELLKDLEGVTNDVNCPLHIAAEIDQTISLFPTADVEEVKHGKWYRHDKKKHGDTCFYCSACEKMALSDCLEWELTKYCPHCGAKMDGGKEE